MAARMTPRANAGRSRALKEPRGRAPSRESAGAEPVEFDGEKQNQQDPQPELRRGQSELGEGHDGHVPRLVLVPGGIDAEGNGNDHRKQHSHEGEGPGHGQAACDQLEHRHFVVDELMALADQELTDPVSVLTQERLVQPQLGPQAGQGFRRDVDPENDLGRVAGQDEQDREHREGHKQQQQNQSDQFFG